MDLAPPRRSPPDVDERRLMSALSTIRLAVSLVYSAGRKRLVLITLATVVTSGAIAGQLIVGRTIVDLLADNDDVAAGDLTPYLLTLGVLLVLSALSQAVSSELRIPLGEQVHRRAMDEILDVATEAELEMYEGPEFHDRMQRARVAAGGQSAAVVFGLVTMVSTLVVAFGVVIVLFTVAPVLVPFALLGYFPIAVVNVRNNRARYELDREQTELQRERAYLEFLMTDRVEAKEVRSYNLAPTFRLWHGELWDTRMKQLGDLVRRRMALTTVGSLVTAAVLIATLSLTLILAGRGSISVGDAAVAIVGLQQLSSRLQATGSAFNSIHGGVTFLRDFHDFRSALPVIRERRPTGVPPTPPTTLSVNGLGYRYPGSTVDALGSVSFELRRGQVMAVVGANGSGKSTLAKLLCDLLPPTRGTIAWDGVDLAECDPARVREQIAPVFQDYAQYMVTIRRSIGLGDVRRLDDDAGIREAAERAGVADLINAQAQGLEARLGKAFSEGIDLSGGQWQRVAIARALFRDTPVVILDEPSASLDPRAETDLFDLLQTMCADRLVIFVSHRFATVRSADVVMVLDQGEVAEIGSHDELMARRGLYRDLFELQATRYGMTH
jgi:ATP-binding cassette subfamily B protein